MPSPYARQNKAPYQPSALYQQWRNTVANGSDAERDDAATKHLRHFAPALEENVINARRQRPVEEEYDYDYEEIE